MKRRDPHGLAHVGRHAESCHEDDEHDGPGAAAFHVPRLIRLLDSLFHSLSPLMKQTMEARQDARHPTLVMTLSRLSICGDLESPDTCPKPCV